MLPMDRQGLYPLQKPDITAQVGIGHSLGELTTLHRAGAMNEEMLFQVTRT